MLSSVLFLLFFFLGHRIYCCIYFWMKRCTSGQAMIRWHSADVSQHNLNFWYRCLSGATSLCSSYPQLLVVPSWITDKELENVAAFRSWKRFPSVVYRLVIVWLLERNKDVNKQEYSFGRQHFTCWDFLGVPPKHLFIYYFFK